MSIATKVSIVSALLSIFLSCHVIAEENEWTQWRGPNRDSQVKSSSWPDKLDGASLTELWRVPLDPSYSGPIVADGYVFVTETRAKKEEVVRALQLSDGADVWRVSWNGAMKVPFFAASNGSWIRSTPAYADGRLFVGGMRDVLVCLDGKTGKENWRVDFVKQLGTPLPAFGFASSPLVTKDGLYVQAGGSLVKLDPVTGKVMWRSLADGGGMSGSAFSSPIVANLLGQQQLVVQTRTQLAGVNPEDGQELWSQDIPAFRGMNILTPTVIGDRVFTSAYGGESTMLSLSNTAGSTQIAEAWQNKKQGYMSSPVVIDGHIYLHLRNQRFTCIEAATGTVKWTTKPYGKYWSMIANGDKILALDQKGELLLIAANPTEFQLLDSRKISSDETWAHLAIVGDTILIRELKAVVAYRWK